MPIIGSLIKRGIRLRRRIIPSGTGNPVLFQRKMLRRLLLKARHTGFGRYYSFEEILAEKDFINSFRNIVPIHTYNSIFNEWWHRCLNGEEDVCWPGSVRYFALSSGTSESSSKHIPVTRDMARAIRRTSIKQIFALANYNLPASLFEKGILMLGGSTHLHQKGNYFEGDLSGISASKLPFWFQHFYKPGKKISQERDWATKLEEIINKAPAWDIGIIVGVPAWIQLLLEKIINRYNLKTIHDIWPNLTIYVHGGVSFEPYRKSFSKLLGKPITYIETYLASEGFIAFQRQPGSNSMKLILNNGLFYEFVPFHSENFTSDGEIKPGAETITIEEIEENKEYALLLTTCAGAWRYLIGDVIKFTSKEKSEIIITGRTKHFLSLCGEHLSVENMNKAVDHLNEELNLDIKEFTVSGIPCGSLFAHKWYLGIKNLNDGNLSLKDKLDEKLKILNDDYCVERTSALKEIIVEAIPVEIFYDFMEKKGKTGGQNKFPRVMKNEPFAEWEQFVHNHPAYFSGINK
jgi:hypothetical protein